MDRFGFGIETNEVTPEIIETIKQSFGDSYGSDLSLLVLEHYKNTGKLFTHDDISSEDIKMLKDAYGVM